MGLQDIVKSLKTKVMEQGICSYRCYREIDQILDENVWPADGSSFDSDAYVQTLHLLPRSTLATMTPRQRVGYEKFRTALYLPSLLGLELGRLGRGVVELPIDPLLSNDTPDERPSGEKIDDILKHDSLVKRVEDAYPGNHSVTAQTAYFVRNPVRSLTYSTLGMTLGLLAFPFALVYGFLRPLDEKEEN
ncbi:hypothetical protein HYT55_04575 [Candidatus Woesearchaeota archaeon]|nr:hypothetical protein [Candidatus Woesearchaeota archaeon]